MEKDYYTRWRNNTLNSRLETDKKYLILKMGSYLISSAGLGWYIIYTLNGIRFAVENGYIPVVDWQNCKIPQYDADKVGKENIWEYFFEQPFQVGLNEAYASGDFWVIDDVRELMYKNSLNVEKMTDFYDKDVLEWRICFQKYVRLKKSIKEYFDDIFGQEVGANDCLLGVLARGTDYVELKPAGHLAPIPISEMLCEIEQESKKVNEYRLFLATEDQNIFNIFRNRYPGKVYSAESKRYTGLGHSTLNAVYTNENGYKRDLEYLYSLYIISRSPIFICAACGGSAIASLMRKEIGITYKFICHGHNKAKGIIVGSFIEKQKRQMFFLGNKPIMFYTLNLFKLLQIEEIMIIISEEVKKEYEKQIGFGQAFGLKISYVISNTYDVVECLDKNSQFITSSKIVMLYADYFCHGKNIVGELSEKINTFDGSYIWGTQNCFSYDSESVEISKDYNVPQKVFAEYKVGRYSLAGRYVFDYDLAEIIRCVKKKNENASMVDVLNEYVNRKKLFFTEYTRGMICIKIYNMNILEETSQMIASMEKVQSQKIGDFESFKQF